MSVSTTASLTRGVQQTRSGRSWATLTVGLLLLLGSVLLVLSGQLVRLQNDKNHLPLLPAQLASGSASGELTLTNTGLLPIEISLEPRLNDGRIPASYPDRVTLSIIQTANNGLLYDGPLRASTGPLLVLRRGQLAHLEVKVARAEAVSDLSTDTPIVLPYSYYWTARAALPWWWWLPATLLMAVVLLLGYCQPWRRGIAP